jgi:allantoinase
MDLVIRSRRVVTPEGVRPASVHIARGKIVAVAEHGDAPQGVPLVDAGDLAVSPGIVDAHVHVNEPGRTEWEGFETATRAAAKGGVTTLVDMPLNSIPATTTVVALEEKRAAAEGKCVIDVGLWGGAVPGNASELVKMLDAGALGFKCFMVDSGVAEFAHVGEADLRAAMGALAESQAPLLCHAELAGPIDAALSVIRDKDPRAYATYLASRPPKAEELAIELLVNLCRESRARVHVVHLSAANALDTVRRAKSEGLPFSAETTPHYLHFAAEEIPDGATAYKCAPPIRERENRERLWGALDEGLVDVVVSDHSPCTPALKKLEEGDFAAAWGGIASLQLGLSIIWTDAKKRGKGLSDVARWMSLGPARLTGLTQKGQISRGFDADLVIWNPEAEQRVEPANIAHRHKITPYALETLSGVVHQTYVRGEKVFDRSAPVTRAPFGRILRREAP